MDGARTPRWVTVAGVAMMLASGGAVGAWTVELPYYAYSPGPVGDALGSVVVDTEVTTYPTPDGLFFLTVSAQEINVFEMVVAGFDRAVDVVRRERVRPPDLSDEEFRQRGLSQMDQATQTAVGEALARLGSLTDVKPGGVEVVDLLREDELFSVDDVILEVEGTEVGAVTELRPLLEGARVGDLVEVVVLRSGDERRLTVDLIPSPDDPLRPLLGIVARTRFPISIETGNIGGPSAGMMYTLAIMDLLSPGDLTKGHIVAGTGTIEEGGAVGSIGGIRQKVVAAEAAGAQIMLVPAANFEEAKTAPRNEMELVPVGSLDEALEFLESLPQL